MFHELVNQGPQEINLLEWMNHTALDITGLNRFSTDMLMQWLLNPPGSGLQMSIRCSRRRIV